MSCEFKLWYISLMKKQLLPHLFSFGWIFSSNIQIWSWLYYIASFIRFSFFISTHSLVSTWKNSQMAAACSAVVRRRLGKCGGLRRGGRSRQRSSWLTYRFAIFALSPDEYADSIYLYWQISLKYFVLGANMKTEISRGRMDKTYASCVGVTQF